MTTTNSNPNRIEPMREQFKVANLIGNVGLIVFVVLALLLPSSYFGLIDIPQQQLLKLFTMLSGLLLTFLAGTIWSEALVGKIERSATNHLCISAGFALAAMLGFFLQNRWSIIIFGIGYLILFFTEENLRKSKKEASVFKKEGGSIITDYLFMRRHLTYKLVIIHLFILLFYIIKV